MPTSKLVTISMIVFMLIVSKIHANSDLTPPAQPIHLKVGYQPYYTESWSAVIIKGKQLWKQYLPAGSTVEFESALRGNIIVDTLVEQQLHIGYVGDMPAIEATFRYLPPRGGVDIRIIGVSGTSKQLCNIVLVKTEAANLTSPRAILEWMVDKRIATPYGTCSDRFARTVFKQYQLSPQNYLNQNQQVILHNFQNGLLEAAILWEPWASQLESSGLAHRVLTGENFDMTDAGFIIMSQNLIEQRPDIHKAWLEAELDAQLFLANPSNADEILRILKEETVDFDSSVLHTALYGDSKNRIKLQFDFIFTERIQELLREATRFLHELPRRPAAQPQLRPESIQGQIAQQILTDRNLTSPVGVIRGK